MPRHTRFHRFIVLWVCLLFCSSPLLFAGDVSLAWDPSTSEDVVGYKVYVGLSPGNYGDPIVIGNQTSYTVTGLSDGNTYYFAATAYDQSGNESGFSNEVSTTVGGSGTTCDLNNDSNINVIDIQGMVNIILGAGPFQDEFDLYADGQINVLDLQILNNVVLGLRSCP
jgi:hypothetical protein